LISQPPRWLFADRAVAQNLRLERQSVTVRIAAPPAASIYGRGHAGSAGVANSFKGLVRYRKAAFAHF
jgi:hypothetical protein